MERREFLGHIGRTALAAGLAGSLAEASGARASDGTASKFIAPPIRDEIRDWHNRQIVIDLHCDVIIQKRLFDYDISARHEPWTQPQPFFRQADVPRMLEGGYTAAALGIHYLPFEIREAWAEAERQVDLVRELVADDDRVVAADTAADVRKAKADGKLAVWPGLEGAHVLGGDKSHIEQARKLGAVYLTLAHFSHNSACAPGLGRGANQTDGISGWGKELIHAMNDLGVIVDVAHVNMPGVVEASKLSKKPVIASHTCSRAVHKTDRGIHDDGLKAIADTGGVIAVIFGPNFLGPSWDAPTDVLVDHIFHIAGLVGPEHMALGTDFDGWLPAIPNDLRDCRDLAWLSQRCIDRGMSRDDVAGMLGLNFLRVLEANGR
jgi:membrane dipeptidase